MIEYHGWLVVQPSPDEDDVRPDSGQHAWRRVRELVDRIPSDTPGTADLRVTNGMVRLHVADRANHNGPRIERVLDIIRQTAREAPGSYGVVYIFDDEDPQHSNEFRVLVIRRGDVLECADPFLSPVEPTIEGP